MLHTKYINIEALALVVSKEKIFTCISFYKTRSGDDAPGAGPLWIPGARLAGFIKRTTIHSYTQNMKALGLVVSLKKIVLYFSHCKSMGADTRVLIRPGPKPNTTFPLPK